MDVFLCWSGEASRTVARALHDWLPCVIQPVRPWYSDEIPRGERWSSAIAQRLEQSAFGIICLTPTAAVSPWVMFEAGALAKSFDAEQGRGVTPLLLGVGESEVPSPLTAFQTTQPTKDGLWRLVRAIDARLPAAQRVRRLEPVFEAFWPDLHDSLDQAVEAAAAETLASPADSDVVQGADSSAGAVFDELLRRARNTSRHLGEIRDRVDSLWLSQMSEESALDPSRTAAELLHRVLDPIDEPDDPWDEAGRVFGPDQGPGARRAADIVYVLEPLSLQPSIRIDRPLGSDHPRGLVDGEEPESAWAGTIEVTIPASIPLSFDRGADVLRRIDELGFKERLEVRHVDDDGEEVVHERPAIY